MTEVHVCEQYTYTVVKVERPGVEPATDRESDALTITRQRQNPKTGVTKSLFTFTMDQGACVTPAKCQ